MFHRDAESLDLSVRLDLKELERPIVAEASAKPRQNSSERFVQPVRDKGVSRSKFVAQLLFTSINMKKHH
jgi:hypothetical protein